MNRSATAIISILLLLAGCRPAGQRSFPPARDINDLYDPLAVLSDMHPVVSSARETEEILATEDRSSHRVEKYYSKSRFRLDGGGSFLYELEYVIAPTQIRADYTITPESGMDAIPYYGIAYRPRGLRSLRYVGSGDPGALIYEDGTVPARSVLLDLWQGTMYIDGGHYLAVDPARPEEVMILGGVASGDGKVLRKGPFRGHFTITLR